MWACRNRRAIFILRHPDRTWKQSHPPSNHGHNRFNAFFPTNPAKVFFKNCLMTSRTNPSPGRQIPRIPPPGMIIPMTQPINAETPTSHQSRSGAHRGSHGHGIPLGPQSGRGPLTYHLTNSASRSSEQTANRLGLYYRKNGSGNCRSEPIRISQNSRQTVDMLMQIHPSPQPNGSRDTQTPNTG